MFRRILLLGCLLLFTKDLAAQSHYIIPERATPNQLVNAYKNNFPSADAKYTGKLVILTGRIKSITPFDRPYKQNYYGYLTMDAGAGNQPVVVYFVDWEAQKALGSIQAGANVSVMGFCQGVPPQLSLINSCVYPAGCGGPKSDFYGPVYELPPSR